MDSEGQSKFLEEYADYVRNVLVPTRNEIKGLFREWKEPGFWARHARRTRLPSPSPIQRAFPRIKRPESVVDKILRKPSEFPSGLTVDSIRRMQDAVAARIVVYFLSNLPLVDHELRETQALEISEESPPIAYLNQDLSHRLGLSELQIERKESGYTSIHYIVRFRRSAVPEDKRPWFEIQVRTLVADLWGEIEHILGYKPEKRTSFAVRKQFQILSAELSAIDEHFNLLFEELSRFQEEVTYADSNPLNAENLPPVLNEMGIGCAQREINGLLKLLASRGFRTVGDLRRELTGPRLESIRNIFHGVKGRVPNNFEIVAAVAACRGIEDPNKIVAAVKEQIAFLDVWGQLRSELG
jgi:putative GTP pyrophosphokinase